MVSHIPTLGLGELDSNGGARRFAGGVRPSCTRQDSSGGTGGCLTDDTVDANLALGFPADARDYGTTAQILVDLGIRSIRLLTNNPAKRAALEELGIPVSGREPLQVPAHPTNISYLQTKRDRLGHLLTDLDAEAAPMAVAATPTDRATP